jgi:hypothetical protein
MHAHCRNCFQAIILLSPSVYVLRRFEKKWTDRFACGASALGWIKSFLTLKGNGYYYKME